MRRALSEHFYDDEFRCRCGCGLLILHPGFIAALEGVRVALNLPMHITSGCRCTRWNSEIGGHPKSLHIGDSPQYAGQQGTLAADIAAVDGAYRGQLFTIAWSRGFSVGWNAKRGFLHLDRRDWLGMPQRSFDYG